MIEAAKKYGKKLTIGYQNRFRPDSQYLRKLCQDGKLGDIYSAKAHAIRRRAVTTWGVFLNEEEQGGGPLIDIGTHALDLTLWMMKIFGISSFREGMNITINALGMPTLLAMFIGMIKFNMVANTSVQMFGLVIMLTVCRMN